MEANVPIYPVRSLDPYSVWTREQEISSNNPESRHKILKVIFHNWTCKIDPVQFKPKSVEYKWTVHSVNLQFFGIISGKGQRNAFNSHRVLEGHLHNIHLHVPVRWKLYRRFCTPRVQIEKGPTVQVNSSSQYTRCQARVSQEAEGLKPFDTHHLGRTWSPWQRSPPPPPST